MGADPLQGDGAGILIQIPDLFYREEMAKLGVALPPSGEYGVGIVFLPQEAASRHACVEEIERSVKAEGQVLLGWRDVPVNRDMPMSPTVRAKEPVIRQVFVGRGADIFVTDALERKLYIIRRRAANAIKSLKLKHGQETIPISHSMYLAENMQWRLGRNSLIVLMNSMHHHCCEQKKLQRLLQK